DNNASALEALATAYPDCPTFRCDVRDNGSVRDAMTKAAQALGGAIEGLIYCVGVDLQQAFSSMTEADYQGLIDINLLGAMRASQAALPYLRQASGNRCIINLSSGAGLQPLNHRSAYCVSKAGLNMLSKCLAMELGEEGIRALTVAPGAVETELLASSYANHEDPDAARAELANR